MKHAILDLIDRTLLVVMLAGGYLVAAASLGVGCYALLFMFGAVHPVHPPDGWAELRWLPWVQALCLPQP